MEIKLTKANFKQEVLESPIPVLVDFFATWCGPCRMIAPFLEEIAEEYEGKVKVGKVNVDEEEALAIEYKVSAIPLVLLFKGGKVVAQSLGYKSKADLAAMLK
ncbi:MAG: thioredoxin [Clostridia bacterium]|nr:thioredoxin [Clostridia bacterium]